MNESTESLKLQGLRVLVVEDEALVALQLEDMLATLGCRPRGLPFIFATGYGAAGVSKLYRDRPVLQKPIFQNQLRRAMLDSLLAA